MAHNLWILVRIISGLWLIGVFYLYARTAYRLALPKHNAHWTGFFAFLICCIAAINVANW